MGFKGNWDSHLPLIELPIIIAFITTINSKGKGSLEIVMIRAERLNGVIEKEGLESSLLPDPKSQ